VSNPPATELLDTVWRRSNVTLWCGRSNNCGGGAAACRPIQWSGGPAAATDARPSAPTIVIRPPLPERLPPADPPSAVNPDARYDLRISTQEASPRKGMTTTGSGRARLTCKRARSAVPPFVAVVVRRLMRGGSSGCV
jgi:hypothetical protein